MGHTLGRKGRDVAIGCTLDQSCFQDSDMDLGACRDLPVRMALGIGS